MIVAAVNHRTTDAWCYALNKNTLHLRITTAADDVERITLWTGDPYEWAPGPSRGKWNWKTEPIEMKKFGTDGQRDFWEAFWQPPYKRARYFFRLTSKEGTWDYGEKGFLPSADPKATSFPQSDFWNSFVFPYINSGDIFSPPSWVSTTLWYQIFPERFRNPDPNHNLPGTKKWARGPVTNNEFYGGTLQGIIQGLDHIQDLGCNGIYLTPIFASDSVHKYDTNDYLKIDPAFGTEQDLHNLVQACHERKMKIMLDAVFNHCGRGFAPWIDVEKNESKSPYASWFHIQKFPLFPQGKDTGNSKESGYETFGFTTSMPKLNTENPEVREYLLGIAEHYVKEYDIDGWRLDVANEVDKGFWREFRTRVKSLKSDVYILGEIWHDSMPWLRGDQYDAVMHYTSASGITDFLNGNLTSIELANFLTGVEEKYPLLVNNASFNLLDSHDTERIISRLNGDQEKLRLALFLLMTLPGSISLYYGTEYAMDGGGDPDNRRCMIWDPKPKELEFKAFLRALIGVRRSQGTRLSHSRRTPIRNPKYPRIFTAELSHGNTRYIILANGSKQSVSHRELEQGFDLVPEDWKILFTDGVEEGNAWSLGPWGFLLAIQETSPEVKIS